MKRVLKKAASRARENANGGKNNKLRDLEINKSKVSFGG